MKIFRYVLIMEIWLALGVGLSSKIAAAILSFFIGQ